MTQIIYSFKKKQNQIFLFFICLMFFALILGCKEKSPEIIQYGFQKDSDSIIIGVLYVCAAETGYSYAHDYGLRQAQRELGMRDEQILRKFNINDFEGIMVEAAMRDLIAEGANIIIATSWGHMNSCEKLAEEFPNIVFAHASGYKSNETNFTNYFGRIYQARYLSGVAAGLHTKSNKIGFVAAQDKSNSEVTSGLNAFAMGVESVNPDAEILVTVTYSWYDPGAERYAAQRLIAEGCDIIAQHVDTVNPQIEAQNAGVWGIGYNTDMKREAPDAVLTSVIWNWSVYYKDMIQSVIDGNFSTEPYFAGLKEGLVDITPLHQDFVTEEMLIAVSQAREKIDNGFNVFEGLLETNDGQIIGTHGESLPDEVITSGINWYYRNIRVIR
ncbi:MAG: BMP family ABC transporter substrate-binding protein [Candidatus Cloacimonetes bacterium]|nr:BMP family ABC transporter substrate-binding protein [Candidatus Cloacimonadota bacterium]